MKRLLVPRRLARKYGGFYFTGLPCKYGHIVERYGSTGHCVECVRLRNAKRIRRVKNSVTRLV